jgi:hypothetical protein
LQYCAPPRHENAINMILSSKTTNNNHLSTYIPFFFIQYFFMGEAEKRWV